MKPSPTPVPKASPEWWHGFQTAERAAGNASRDPQAREKAWEAAIAAAEQADRLVADAGAYGAAVADDPAKLFRAARAQAQTTANGLPMADVNPAGESADEAVSAVAKFQPSRDWSAVPGATWEGSVCPSTPAHHPAPGSPAGLNIVHASIQPTAAPTGDSRQVKLENYLDLTSPAIRARLLVGEEGSLTDEALVRQLSREAYAAGFNGLIMPAAASTKAEVIVAFGSF